VTSAADECEFGSVFKAGSKKQSLNHLLNFQFEPRGTGARGRDQYYHRHPPANKKSGYYGGTQRPKYNKEHYLQAK